FMGHAAGVLPTVTKSHGLIAPIQIFLQRMRLFLGHIALGLLFSLYLAGNAATQERSRTPAEIEQIFERGVLVQNGAASDWYVTRWDDEIRLSVLSEDGMRPAAFAALAGLIADLERSTGAKIVVTSGQTNFLVLLSTNTKADIVRYRPQL